MINVMSAQISTSDDLMLSAQTFGLRFRIVLTQARDITPLYASYISEYAIDATTSTHMLYLLKRPLVRIRYLAKVMKAAQPDA